MNIARRHLPKGQRAMAIAKLYPQSPEKGGRGKTSVINTGVSSEYVKQSSNNAVKVRDLNQDAVIAASSLRVRAERRVGELQAIAPKDNGGRPSKTKPVNAADRFSLGQKGLTRNESSEYQKLARIPEPQFEQACRTSPACRPSPDGGDS